MLTNKFKDNVFEKIILLLFIITSLFLISMSIVVGQVVIDGNTINVPDSISENSDVSVSFSASTDSDVNINYSIYYDGKLVSDSDTASVFMNYSSSGNHTFKFFASDNESNDSEIRYITVIDSPLTLALVSPVVRTYNSRAVLIEVDTSNPVDICVYRLNDSANIPLIGSNQNFYQNISVSQDGSYILTVNCSNNYDSTVISSTFTVDTVVPVISSKSYVIGANNVVTINAVTDVSCICKYDTVDRSYESMGALFVNTNNLQHSTMLSGLHDGSYTYYIRCKNADDNVANVEAVSFDIVTRPTATISLSKSPPIKAGTYEVNLVTSKPVNNAPSLYYTFENDVSPKYVTLTGSGTDWKGYLIIEEDVPNKIGSFHYSATDFNNNVGTLITDGQIFLIDTIKPVPPSSMAAIEESDGNIRLKWYYDGERAVRYNIYRSTNGDPDYVDYYDSTTSKQYVDKDVIDGLTYYYKLAAVDAADNDGLLSEVIEATSLVRGTVDVADYADAGSTNIVSKPQILDYALVPKIDQLVAEFNIYLTDIAAVKSELDKTNDPNVLKVITILHLSEKTKAAQDTVNGLIIKANELKAQNLKLSELDVQLNKLRMEGIKAKSTVAEDIFVSEQSEYDQVTQESDVDMAISEVVNINLSKKVLSNYSLNNKQIQDNIVVKTDILIFKIKYLGKDDYDKYTLVKKMVISSQELSDISIIEVIPKSFETKASDIIFDIDDQQKPVIVKDDPVLRWDVDSFSKQAIYYMINNNAEMSSAKGTKTVVIYRPDFKVTQTIQEDDTDDNKRGNLFTGFVSLENVNMSKLSFMQWLVIIGIGMILGLSAYYVALDKKEKKRGAQRLKDQKIMTKPQPKPVSTSVQRTTSTLPGTKSQVISRTSTTNVFFTPVPLTSPATSNKSVNILAMSVSDMNAKLDRANSLINSFDYENARILYNECIQSYPKIVFKNNSEKAAIKVMLEHIFHKITVYRIIYSSRKHVNTKNYTLLKQDIAMINKICNKLYSTLGKIDEDNINAEKKFVDYVSNSRKHLESISS